MNDLFRQSGFDIGGRVLSKDAFRPYLGYTETEYNPDRIQPIIERADRYLAEDIPLLPVTLWMEFVRTGNRSHYQEPWGKRRNMLLDLAIAEQATRTGRYVDKICDCLWAIMEESTWVIHAHDYVNPHCHEGVPATFGDRMHGIDLHAAYTAATLAFVYDALKDALDAVSCVLCEKLSYLLHQRIVEPFLNIPFGWSGIKGNRPNNWCPWIVSNVLYVMALTTEDMAEREAVCSRAMEYLDCFIQYYKDDGGCDEGPSYWTAAGASYFDSLELLYDLTGGYVDLFSHPLLRAVGEYEVRFHIHENRFINFADCAPTVNPGGVLLRRFGERVGSVSMCSLGDTLELLCAQRDAAPSHVYRSIINLMRPTVTSARAAAITRYYFEHLKVMIARESEDTSKGLFVAMKGGHNKESHNHNDVGSLVVYYEGDPVLIDTGAGAYTRDTFGPNRYSLWFMQSAYHNTVTVNGFDQLPGEQYRSCDEEYDESTGAVCMQLKNAYPSEAGIESYERYAVLADGALYVTDTFALREIGEVDIHFITHEKPRRTDEGTLALAKGRTLVIPQNTTCEIEPFPVAEAMLEKRWNTDELYRIHLRAKIKEGAITTKIY